MKNPKYKKSSEWEDFLYFKGFLDYYVKRRHLGLRARFYMAGMVGFECSPTHSSLLILEVTSVTSRTLALLATTRILILRTHSIFTT